MKSEKSKVLGVLLPSESCHMFEVLYLQYSYDKAHTFYFGALRLFLVFEKENIFARALSKIF